MTYGHVEPAPDPPSPNRGVKAQMNPTPASGRRRAAAVAALALAGTAVLTGAALIGTAQAAGTLQLQYKTTATGSDQIEPWFTVTNGGSSAVSLNTVAI